MYIMFSLKEIKARRFYYNSLYYDFIFSGRKLMEHFHYDFHRVDDIRKRAQYIADNYNNGLRVGISKILEDFNLGLGCGSKVIDNCRSLGRSDSMVVIGGQQPGFFTGPIFVIYKAMSIIKISEFLSDMLDVKVIPVFWNASDDSNFDQINRTSLLNKDQTEITLEYTGTLPKRFSDIQLDKKMVSSKIKEMLAALPETEFKAGIRALLDSCLAHFPEVPTTRKHNLLTPPGYFSALLSRMFSEHGLVIIDPAGSSIKKLGMELLDFDIRNFTALADIVNGSGQNLAGAGYHSQLTLDREALDFFIVKDGFRHKVRRYKRQASGKDLYITSHTGHTGDAVERIFTEVELSDFITRNPGDLSFNVLLRPLFQDTVLPVICTVCGPGEAGYFAQFKGVYELLNIMQPVIYPRFSATIIENKLKKSFERTGIGYDALEYDRNDILNKIIMAGYGSSVKESLNNMETSFISGLEKTRHFLDQKKVKADNAFKRAETNIRRELDVLGSKITAEIVSRENVNTDNIEKIYRHIFPKDVLQERVVNIFNYINKYDFVFLNELYDNIEIRSYTHKFMEID